MVAGGCGACHLLIQCGQVSMPSGRLMHVLVGIGEGKVYGSGKEPTRKWCLQ